MDRPDAVLRNCLLQKHRFEKKMEDAPKDFLDAPEDFLLAPAAVAGKTARGRSATLPPPACCCDPSRVAVAGALRGRTGIHVQCSEGTDTGTDCTCTW